MQKRHNRYSQFIIASIYIIDAGKMIFRAEVRFNQIVPVFIYRVDEPSTKLVTRKNELPNKVPGS